VDRFNKFLKHCEQGELPPVSFIDPNWRDIPDGPPNDDHPPEADIGDGQRLVAQVYEALRTGGNNLFERTLFLITYDEHGGFYDHVLPPPAPDYLPQDHASLKTYGVRVPALVVSPWVPKGSVSHALFDHTAILKTILLRFCDTAAIHSLERQGRRVAAAAHLGELLIESRARTNLPMAASLARSVEGSPRLLRSSAGRLCSDLVMEIEAARAAALACGVPEDQL
jgi:phospholipase C